jgi:hypothetical protein
MDHNPTLFFLPTLDEEKMASRLDFKKGKLIRKVEMGDFLSGAR